MNIFAVCETYLKFETLDSYLPFPKLKTFVVCESENVFAVCESENQFKVCESKTYLQVVKLITIVITTFAGSWLPLQVTLFFKIIYEWVTSNLIFRVSNFYSHRFCSNFILNLHECWR